MRPFKALISLYTAIALLSPLAGNAQTSAPSRLETSEVMVIAQKWAHVVGQPDLAGLELLLHNDYQHTHATALVESKDKFIDALKTGARKYDPIALEETKVRVFGDTAVVSGQFALRATIRDRVIESVNRFSLVVVKTPQGLQVASFQATAIPPVK